MLLTEIIAKNLVLEESQLKTDIKLLKLVQSRLAFLGFYSGAIDGIYGPKTIAALTNFCAARGLNNFKTQRYGSTFARALLEEEKSLTIISKAQARAIFGRDVSPEQLADLNSCLVRFEINTKPRLTHFLSQICHESGNLRWLRELASGEAYEGRRDLGNTKPGWGKLYRGGGVLQTTGRFNYEKLCKEVGDPKILELGAEYVASHYPFTAGGVWWRDNGMNRICDNGASVEKVTLRVNGGRNGLSDRQDHYARICKILGA